MTTAAPAVLCSSCGGRLARDNTGTVCSPCRRTHIENAAHVGAITTRDGPRIAITFEALGLIGVADELACSPQDALDVLLNLQLVPFVSAKRRMMLRDLLDLDDETHVAAAEALHISRWTVATYRRQLGLERPRNSATSGF